MGTYTYEAVNAAGLTIKGVVEVACQSEALSRIRDMGLFPLKVKEQPARRLAGKAARKSFLSRLKGTQITIPFLSGRVKRPVVAAFTRQLATVIEAGMPLLRGLRLLQEQESNTVLRKVIGDLGTTIEGGNTLSEALMKHPRIFSHLYVSMVRAGESGGVLDITLRRLSEFMDKAQKIKSKVVTAMFYPASVLVVATAILGLMLMFVIPRFKQVFEGLLPGESMPAFTVLVLRISDAVRHSFPVMAGGIAVVVAAVALCLRTKTGRSFFDGLKLRLPVFGNVQRKSAISRFARTLGTLMNSGVPVLQALEIVRQTAGNIVVGRVIGSVHDSVREGDAMALQLKASRIFPPLVAGMVDVGEQTGELPNMLLRIADNYDDEVDNAVSAMTSLLEPILIVFLAVVVGSIVLAMFWPIVILIDRGPGGDGSRVRDGGDF